MKMRLAATVLLLTMGTAWADAPGSVYLVGSSSDAKMDALIRTALAEGGGLKVLDAPAEGALFLAIPGGMARQTSGKGGGYAFTVVFSHNGAKLGESLEECSADMPKLCADQLAADALSAVLAASR